MYTYMYMHMCILICNSRQVHIDVGTFRLRFQLTNSGACWPRMLRRLRFVLPLLLGFVTQGHAVISKCNISGQDSSREQVYPATTGNCVPNGAANPEASRLGEVREQHPGSYASHGQSCVCREGAVDPELECNIRES